MTNTMIHSKNEIRILSRFCALRLSRFLLLTLLFPAALLHFSAAYYVIAGAFAFPAAINLSLETSHPERNTIYQRSSSIPKILQEYHFSHTKYRAECFGFILIITLLALWQWVQPAEYWYDFPVGRVPLFYLAFYYVLQTILFFCYRSAITKEIK